MHHALESKKTTINKSKSRGKRQNNISIQENNAEQAK
jgi:hypothetical protein